jgi:TonB-linked SusC/RagA family outer membrane protein
VSSSSYAQRLIKGNVTDASDGSPIPGVNIVETGTTNGVVSGDGGQFSITVSEKATTLTFSFIGYQSQTVSIEGTNQVAVSLKEGNSVMNEIVVTALGIKKEEKALGYSVQRVSGDDALANGNPNPIAGLQGKVAGIQVQQSSGTPGGSSKITIRGNATFGDNQPLIVIDGVPIDNSTNNTSSVNVNGVDQSNRAIDINPDDIESVSVLKGAAATALYGSRAGNGVIIYTTKKGQSSGEGRVIGKFSTDITLTNPVNLHEKQQVYGQTAEGSSMSWGDKVAAGDIVNVEDDYFRTGVSKNVNLSLSGGNDKSNVRFSVGYTNAQGIIPNSNWDRISTRLTASTKLTDRLKVSGTMNLINSGGNRAQKGSNLAGVMLSLYRTPINYDPRKAYYDDAATKGTNSNYFSFYDNPYFSAEKNTYIDNVWRVLGNITTTYDIIPLNDAEKLRSLVFTYRTGIDAYSDVRKGQSAIGSNTTSTKRGQIIDYTGVFYEWNNDYILNGDIQLQEDLNLSATLGANARARKDEYNFTTGTNLVEEDFYNIANAESVVAEQYKELVNEYAGYVDLSFGYKNTYYLGLSGRNEWSSKYDPDNNSYFFPSANASFVFSELLEENENSILSFGKLRASIGKTGIAPAPWRYASYTEAVNVRDGFTDGNTTAPDGSYLTNFGKIKGNPNLTPEIQVGSEVGLDLRFWDGKLTLDLGVYDQQVSDLLISVPVTTATGFEFEYKNIGKMQNRGIELSLGYNTKIAKQVKWNSTFNFGRNKNTVLELADGVDEVSLGGGFTSISAYARADQAFGVFYGTDWEKDKQGNLLVGEDGLYIEGSEKVLIGDPNPDFTLGFRNSFSYKNFSLNIFFDGLFGGDVYNGTRAMMNFRGIGKDSEDREGTVVLEGVKADGTKNTTEISKQEYWQFIDGIASAASAQVEKDIYFVKLRELGLSYRLPLEGKQINTLNFSIIGTNLLTFTNYSTGDPETSLTGAGSNTSGFDYFNSPNVRGLVFKVAATF